MQLEANQISRDWTILHKGRKFYVNYTDSDGHTLALMNRGNWEVIEERDDDTEELNVYLSITGHHNWRTRSLINKKGC